MLPLNYLRVFHVLAEQQSVLKAADTLFISQPAVSNSIKKLQANIGLRLFSKQGRSLVLTEHGEMLYNLTTRLFAVELEIEQFLDQLHSTGRQHIRLGLVTIYERFGIEDILRSFSEIDPNISVSVHSGNSRSIAEMIKNNNVDMAICGNVVVDPELCYEPYQKHELFMVAPKGHSLYGQDIFTAEDMRNERMVLKEAGSSVRHTTDAFFDRHSICPQIVTELSNLDSILNLVKREQCLTFLPDLSVFEKIKEDSSFSLARHDGHELSFNTYVVYPKSPLYAEATNSVIKRFCEKIRQAGATYA